MTKFQLKLSAERHAQKQQKEAGCTASDCEMGLTEAGREHSNRAGMEMVRKNPGIKKFYLYSSDVERAYETAECKKNGIVAQSEGAVQVEIIRTKDLGFDFEQMIPGVLKGWGEADKKGGESAGIRHFLALRDKQIDISTLSPEMVAAGFARVILNCIEVSERESDVLFDLTSHSGFLESFLLYTIGKSMYSKVVIPTNDFLDRIGGVLEMGERELSVSEDEFDRLIVSIRGVERYVTKEDLVELAQKSNL